MFQSILKLSKKTMILSIGKLSTNLVALSLNYQLIE